MAFDSTAQTEAVAEGIRQVTQGSNLLAAELGESGANLVSDLEQVIATFHTADAETRRRLAEIGEQGRTLSEDLQRLRASIQADRILAETIERSCERLEHVAAQSESCGPAVPDAGQAEVLRKLQERYTMQVERAVHSEALAEDDPVAVAAGGLGNNVELF